MMKHVVQIAIGFAAALGLTVQAEAFTSRQPRTVPITGSGVTATMTMDADVVTQGSGDPGTVVPLSFGSGVNDFRDSGESIRITINSNLAGNRVIIYTDNLNSGAVPKFCDDTSKGNDGGGLVGAGAGADDCKVTVPLLWAVQDSNVTNYGFTSGTIGDDEIFITDRAHVVTYVDGALGIGAPVAEKQKLDTMLMKRCDTGAAVANPDSAGTLADPERYPQLFGSPGIADSDMCSAQVAPITISGITIQPCPSLPCPADSRVPFAQELNKNIAVVGYGFLGTVGNAPDLSSPSTTDFIAVTSPFYLPIAADFRTASGQSYATSTLTVELVTQ